MCGVPRVVRYGLRYVHACKVQGCKKRASEPSFPFPVRCAAWSPSPRDPIAFGRWANVWDGGAESCKGRTHGKEGEDEASREEPTLPTLGKVPYPGSDNPPQVPLHYSKLGASTKVRQVRYLTPHGTFPSCLALPRQSWAGGKCKHLSHLPYLR